MFPWSQRLSYSLRSFRVRVALLSVLLCAVILLVFSGFAWRLLYRTALHRVDATLRDLATVHLSLPREPRHWARLDQSLASVYGGEGTGILLRVADAEGLLHQSRAWSIEEELPGPGALQAADRRPPMPLFGPGGLQRGPRPPRRPGPPPGRPGDPNGPFGPGPPPPDFMEDDPFAVQDPPGPGPQAQRFPPPDPLGFGQRGGRGEQPLPLRAPRFVTLMSGGVTWRVGAFGNDSVTLHAAIPLSAFQADLAAARLSLLLGLPLALACVALGSWWLSGRALRPVRSLTAAVAGVSARGLDQRLTATTQDREFSELIAMFNAMLARLQGSFEQTLRFSADAAHELKTPLTIIQGELERALQRAAPEAQETLARLLEETQRLKAIVQKLLLLALADAGQLRLHIEPLDLTEMTEEMAEDARILAPQLQVSTEIAPGVTLAGDRHLLRQALQNIVTNALKYTPSGGGVHLSLGRAGGRVAFRVVNAAELPAEAREHLFERFYRGDKARNRQIEGTGLGLSLAREIVRAHGGDLVLDPPAPGRVSFTLWLGDAPGVISPATAEGVSR